MKLQERNNIQQKLDNSQDLYPEDPVYKNEISRKMTNFDSIADPKSMLNYQILKKMAPALFGDVLLCKDKRTKKLVAIKRMELNHVRKRKTIKGNHTVPEDVYAECEANIKFRKSGGHPNVLNMQTHFSEGGKLHFVFDYCKKGELFDVVSSRKKGYLSATTARDYFRQILRGVQFVHHCGYAHRDLSLENVLVDEKGILKVCDFGLVARASSLSKQVVGKKFYMAPEVVEGRVYNPVKADSWSLGIMLFMMLAGQPPLEQASMSDKCFCILTQHGIEALIDMWKLRKLFPVDALDLITKMLQVSPLKRISVDDILKHPWICDSSRQEKLEDYHPNAFIGMKRHSNLHRAVSFCSKLLEKIHFGEPLSQKRRRLMEENSSKFRHN